MMDGSYSELFGLELEMTGRVRWFDEGRGFGFVVCDKSGTDVLLHENSLYNFGQNTIADGTRVHALFVDTDKGRRITSVIDLELGPDQSTETTEKAAPDPADEGGFQPARVKWFSEDAGYGFVNVFGDPQDYFLHIKQIERCGFKKLSTGEAVAVKVSADDNSVRWIKRWLGR